MNEEIDKWAELSYRDQHEVAFRQMIDFCRHKERECPGDGVFELLTILSGQETMKQETIVAAIEAVKNYDAKLIINTELK